VLTGPVTLASLSLDKHYGNKKALAGAFASAIGEEVGALVKAGASQIQIDEPILTQHPEDLSLVSEGLDRIRGHKAKATLTLFTFFGDVAGIYKDLQEVPAEILGLDLVQGAATWPVLAKHGSSKPLVLGVIDARVDPVPGGNRHRHPRRRGTVPGRHGDLLRRKPRRDGDFRPGPFVREPLLQETDRRRGAQAPRPDQRRLVFVRAIPDGPAGQGDDHGTLHDDGLVLRRILRLPDGGLSRLREAPPRGGGRPRGRGGQVRPGRRAGPVDPVRRAPAPGQGGRHRDEGPPREDRPAHLLW